MAGMAALAEWEADARKRLFAATDALAHRLGADGVNREARASRQPDPTPKSVGELEATAILAESLVRLGEDVDALQARVAGSKGGRP